MTHPFFADTPLPRVLAHRGLAAGESVDAAVWENTAGAFAAAEAAGTPFVETDCRLSADGDVVLFHDPDLRRLTGDTRPVAAITTRELREIFADHGGLMTLADALGSFGELRFNVDVKSEDVIARIGPIVAPHTRRVLLTSFSDARRRRAIAAVRAAGAVLPPATSAGRNTILAALTGSQLRLGPLVSRALRDVDALQIPQRQGPLTILTDQFIRRAHEHGVEVHVWTVNDPLVMRELVARGVDGIVTDRADLALATLR